MRANKKQIVIAGFAGVGKTYIRKTAKTIKEKKIVLHNNQTLEDWLKKHNYKLIENED